MVMHNINCELCDLVFDDNIKTSLIYKDKYVTITYCDTHKDTPMVVLNNHKSKISYEQLRHIAERCAVLFPDRKFRKGMNSILDHWHAHLILKTEG